jgi:hypothetical protein
VLKLLTSGAPTKEIAAKLVVSENTVNYPSEEPLPETGREEPDAGHQGK